MVNLNEVEVKTLPRNLPESITVDVQELAIGDVVHLSDLKLPEGVTIPALEQGEGHDQAVASITEVRVTAEDVEAEAAEAEAKVDLVHAQIAKMQAETGKTTLDIEDQYTGRKHAQDMERQQAQSAGNQELQITKALTTPRKEGERDPDIAAAIGYQQLSAANSRQ